MHLIDTDILVFSLKNDPSVVANFRANAASSKAISVISLAELSYGARKSARPAVHLAAVQRIRELFPVHDVTPGVADVFSALKADLEQGGNRLDDFDLLIGATALFHHLTLVTHNTTHFSRIDGLRLEDWKA